MIFIDLFRCLKWSKIYSLITTVLLGFLILNIGGSILQIFAILSFSSTSHHLLNSPSTYVTIMHKTKLKSFLNMVNWSDLNFPIKCVYITKIKKTIVFPFLWSDVLWASFCLFEKVAVDIWVNLKINLLERNF